MAKNAKKVGSVRNGQSVKVHYGNNDFTGKVVRHGSTPRTGRYVTVRFDFDPETEIETDFSFEEVRAG